MYHLPAGCCDFTLPKTNSFAPENGWLEDDVFPFGFRPIFCGYVSFREGTRFLVSNKFHPKKLGKIT